MQDVQATSEASSPQKKTPITSKQYSTFLYFLWFIFSPGIRIRIHKTEGVYLPAGLDMDPDPQHSTDFNLNTFTTSQLHCKQASSQLQETSTTQTPSKTMYV